MILISAATAVAQTTQVVLNPGDALRITVWRQPELSGEFLIAEDGTITHPLLRSVSVVNVPLPTINERVRAYLERLENEPAFVLQPLLRVSVTGEVRNPDLYRLPPETRVIEAVALAGGATDRGALDRVRLIRDGREILIDLTQPDVGVALEGIRSGDRILVERKSAFFRDYVVPAGSIFAAVAALLNIVVN